MKKISTNTYPSITDIILCHFVDERGPESNRWGVQKRAEGVVSLLVIQNQTIRQHTGPHHGYHPCKTAAGAVHFAAGNGTDLMGRRRLVGGGDGIIC